MTDTETPDNLVTSLMGDAPNQPTETPATPPDVQQTPPSSFDPKALAKEFASSLKDVFPQTPPVAPVQPQMTPEEAKKLLNMWEPDDNFLQEFGNIETQKAAFAKMRDGLTKQMLTIVSSLMQDQLSQRLSPLEAYYQKQQDAELQSSFEAAYPALADAKLRPLIHSVANTLAGQNFPSREAGFEALAKGVEAIIKTQNPSFVLTAGKPAQTNPQGRQAVKTPVVSSGAGGGGGQGAGGSGQKTGSKVVGLL